MDESVAAIMDAEDTRVSDKVSVVLRAGASIVGSRPLFSPDTKLVSTFSLECYKIIVVTCICLHETLPHGVMWAIIHEH